MSMFHSNTELLIDYWRERSHGGALPARSSVNPADFSALLPQVFVLGRVRAGLYPVRLAGGFIADLHRCDLRQQNGLGLWTEADRGPLQAALEESRRNPEPIVVSAEVVAEGSSIPMEVLFAPLAGLEGGPDRYLGLYQPRAVVARLMGRPAQALSIRAIHTADAAESEAPRLRLATVDGRRIA